MNVYYCNLCDITIKLRYKKKYLNTKFHIYLSESIFNKYYVKNPKLKEIEIRLKR